MQPTISDIARDHLHWALTDGVGPIVFTRLLTRFGDARTALGATTQQFQSIERVGRASAENIARCREDVDVSREIEAARSAETRIICRADPEYPPGLLQIPDAPIVLYIRGVLRETDAVAVAIVGSRRCSVYGSEQARRFGELLTGAGFTIVSGLARGIDAFAHHGAVDGGGRSIAVMGRGLDEIYPPENRALAEKVLASGAWISELPMQSAVRSENFPGRNRIIAGMTLGTLVVEAGERSGALITARLATEYNREIFAVPGRLQEPSAMGTNALIRDSGAKLVTCLEDILEELGDVGKLMRPVRSTKTAAGAGERDTEPPPQAATALNETEQAVYNVVGCEPVFQDAVLSSTGLHAGDVLAAFTALEIKGLIKRLPGQLVVRARRGVQSK